VPVASVFVATFLAFSTSMRCGFVNLDDPVYVTRNGLVSAGITANGVAFAFSSVGAVYWHPLTWLSHMLDCALFGLAPGPHHFTSVLLHAANAALLLLVLWKLTNRAWLSVSAATLWAIHPLRVESVTWIAERKDVLSGFFGLAALLVYSWYVKRPARRRYLALSATFALGLMSKPVLVTLPFLLLLLDYWPLRRALPWPRLACEKAPLLAMSAIVSVLAFVGQQKAGAMTLVNVPLSTRVESAVVGYASYLGKMIWPVNLACHYPYRPVIPPGEVIFSIGVLGLLAALLVWQRKRRPYVVFGGLWFAVSLLPMSGLVQVGRQALADRFTYWPMIGLTVAAVWLAADWLEAKPRFARPVRAGALILAVSLALATHRQIGYWRDSVTLFERALRAGGDNEYIRGNLAATLIESGRMAEAEPHLLAAIRMAPALFHHHHNLARSRMHLGRFPGAVSAAEEAVRLAPGHWATHQLLAAALLRVADYQRAQAELTAAIERGFEPAKAAILLNDAAVSLAGQKQFANAEILLRGAVGFDPARAEAQKNLTLVLLDQGRPDEARTQIRSALATAGPHPDLLRLSKHLAVFGAHMARPEPSIGQTGAVTRHN
jgi:tetratricopeptide (TPR) repeat protein